MKLLSWNCRGAGSSDTIRYIVRMVQDYKPNILFLMETRVPSVQAHRLLRKTHYSHIAAVEARGFAGGLWCLWDTADIKIRVLSHTAQVLNIAILERDTPSSLISLIYASPQGSMREKFYHYVEDMASYVNLPWLLVGDFNQVIRQEDKRGGRPVGGVEVDRLKQMVESCNLIELEFGGPRFTWSNGQMGRNLIEQRLDQA